MSMFYLSMICFIVFTTMERCWRSSCQIFKFIERTVQPSIECIDVASKSPTFIRIRNFIIEFYFVNVCARSIVNYVFYNLLSVLICDFNIMDRRNDICISEQIKIFLTLPLKNTKYFYNNYVNNEININN